MSGAFPEWLPPFLIIVLAWIGVLYIISLFGGWLSLARVYPASQFLPGKRFSFQSASMRASMNYNNCLILEANAQGLRISVFFLLRFGHPPLFVPWEDITVELRRFLRFKYVRLRFAKCPNIPFSISLKLAKKLSQASGFQLTIKDE